MRKNEKFWGKNRAHAVRKLVKLLQRHGTRSKTRNFFLQALFKRSNEMILRKLNSVEYIINEHVIDNITYADNTEMKYP